MLRIWIATFVAMMVLQGNTSVGTSCREDCRVAKEACMDSCRSLPQPYRGECIDRCKAVYGNCKNRPR